VVTLLPSPQDEVVGRVYLVPPASRSEVLARLDHREKGGYARVETEVDLLDRASDGPAVVRALIYIATPDNPNYLGPASEREIAEQVLASAGPSGPNDEYVLRLAAALDEVGHPDPHVEAVAAHVAAVRTARGE
jgi:cation transport regulator ChaC